MRAVNRWLVTVIWLVSLALPLQGLAASLPVAALAAGHMTGVAVVQPETGAHPCHVDTAAVEAHAADPHAGCAACAACHGGTAPAPSLAALPALPAPAEPLPGWSAPALQLVVPDGPERPPRTDLA